MKRLIILILIFAALAIMVLSLCGCLSRVEAQEMPVPTGVVADQTNEYQQQIDELNTTNTELQSQLNAANLKIKNQVGIISGMETTIDTLQKSNEILRQTPPKTVNIPVEVTKTVTVETIKPLKDFESLEALQKFYNDHWMQIMYLSPGDNDLSAFRGTCVDEAEHLQNSAYENGYRLNLWGTDDNGLICGKKVSTGKHMGCVAIIDNDCYFIDGKGITWFSILKNQ